MPLALPSIRLCLDPVSFPGLSQATDLVSRGCDRSHVSFFSRHPSSPDPGSNLAPCRRHPQAAWGGASQGTLQDR